MELILVDLSPVYQRLFHYIFGIKFCNEIYFCKEIPKGVIVNFYIIYLNNRYRIDHISMEHKMVRRRFICGITD